MIINLFIMIYQLVLFCFFFFSICSIQNFTPFCIPAVIDRVLVVVDDDDLDDEDLDGTTGHEWGESDY